MQIEFESDYQKKVLIQKFGDGSSMTSKEDVQTWKSQWMNALSSWHSPYKCLIDCRELSIADSVELQTQLSRLFKLFEGFFLKKAVGISRDPLAFSRTFPIPFYATEEEASNALGIRANKTSKKAADFRSSISFQNHFRQHTIELSFVEPVLIDSKSQLDTLKSKLTNNLMQWHSKWNLLVDCSNLEFKEDMIQEFESIKLFFQRFFMKNIIGYSPKRKDSPYPFKTYRSRHKAAAELEAEGAFSGEEADCLSRKGQKADA